ncbi:MAG: hypothetical protein B6I20_05460 [Bacteroidetes bacterium 4572_117]|nr:MAG: hypothetical protein B6I20_05460 [Bacteroidetes bacterium 4572_117]
MARLNKNNSVHKEIEDAFKPKFVRRFYSTLDNAKNAAHELFSKLGVKQAVYVFKSGYGHMQHRCEYSLRLLSEGVRPDSMAIIYTVTK